MGTLGQITATDAELVLLVKPQFEAGRDAVGHGGVVREPESWADAIRGVADAANAAGLRPLEVMASPVRGPAGNVEFLLHATKTAAAEPGVALDVDGALAEGLDIGGRT
jgi:23S rRNA (cytidine1920-2'-O)/16S rRNA (cytidine1409-2'-O)-methyltransferase